MSIVPAHIALFAFNRPERLRETLAALAANSLAAESDCTIFCDAPRHEAERPLTDAVREIAAGATGFRSVAVVARDRNLGCAGSIIGGLDQLFAVYERLVVFEDDILSSPHTLRYLNDGLARFAAEPTVFSISAWSPPPRYLPVGKHSPYPYDAYFIPRFHCWGWATWRDRYRTIDWTVPDYAEFRDTPVLRDAYNMGGDCLSPMLDMQMRGELDSWAVRADYARFRHGGLSLLPVWSCTTNTGFGSGTHTRGEGGWLDNDIGRALEEPRLPRHVFQDVTLQFAYRNLYSKDKIKILRRA